MLFSVVVPVGSKEPTLEVCLRSLLTQDYPHNYEIVLSAYGFGRSYFDTFQDWPRLRFVSGSAQDIYDAKNRGVKASTGDCLAFIHPHCQADPQWLQAFTQGLQGFHFLLGYCAYQSDLRAMKLLEMYENHKATVIYSEGVIAELFAYSNNLAIRREAFLSHGPFPLAQHGGATILAQNMAEALGPDCLAFCPHAQVCLQPLTSFRAYVTKRFLYGRRSAILRRKNPTTNYRALNNKRRGWLLSSLCRQKRLRSTDQLILAVHLLLGWLSFESGQLWARNRQDLVRKPSDYDTDSLNAEPQNRP